MLDVGRSTVVVFASISALVILLGLLAAFLLEISTWSTPTQSPLPPAYKARPLDVTFEALDARLLPPRNIEFVNQIGVIDGPVKENRILGYFIANTDNQLAPPPNDFLIIGGQDAGLFDRRIDTRNKRSVLVPGKEFIELVNSELAKNVGPQRHTYMLTVLAYDDAGNRSESTSVSIPISIGKAAERVSANNESAPVQVTESALDKLASEIAFALHPERPPKAEFMAAFKIARTVPERCKVRDDDLEFLKHYRQAFEHIRSRLTAKNMRSVFLGLCDAWQGAIAKERKRKETFDGLREAARQTNSRRMSADYSSDFAAAQMRNAALMTVGGAIVVFLFIVLLLALLSIERHTRALHEHMDILNVAEPGHRSGDTPASPEQGERA